MLAVAWIMQQFAAETRLAEHFTGLGGELRVSADYLHGGMNIDHDNLQWMGAKGTEFVSLFNLLADCPWHFATRKHD